MKKREAINLALHIGIGGALTALVMWHILFINLAVFIYLWLREQAQHRWILEDVGHFDGYESRLNAVHKQTFFGWMTWHRIWEVFQWVIGSAVVSIPWYLFGG